MKLSGGFSQMGKQQPESPMTVPAIVDRLEPWVDVVITAFKPDRIMFGSDWPVCNLGGPGDELSWSHWKNVISAILDEHKLSKAEKDRIWYGTAVEAYNLDTVTG
jgi:L-rhamnono-1,4-lactonase